MRFKILAARLLIAQTVATLGTRSLLFSCLALAAHAIPPHVALLKDGLAAAKAGDTDTAITKLEAAAKLRPDYPRIQLNLARLYARAERTDDSVAALQRLAGMGVAVAATMDPTLAPLQEVPPFQTVFAQLAAPRAQVGDVSATSLDGVTGILEGPLVDSKTGAWYFGDVRNRCIWRHRDGDMLRRFTADADELDGVFKLALSADGSVLWASTAAVGVMTGAAAEDGSRSALVAFDFATGRVRSVHSVPTDGRKHLLGDFLLTADGAAFATDTLSPVIWHLSPGGKTLEPWLESDDFLNLQGLAFSPDGKVLYVADYANGVWRIDVATKEKSLLVAPPNATFFGIDGIYAVPSGLLAIQNGVNPQRVLLISPATGAEPSPARVIVAGHPAMTDLALGTVDGNQFRFIADSGWALFDPEPATPPAPRTVTVYSIAIR